MQIESYNPVTCCFQIREHFKTKYIEMETTFSEKKNGILLCRRNLRDMKADIMDIILYQWNNLQTIEGPNS